MKAGIKPSGGLDLAVLVADGPCAAAGTFTTNRVCAAPVQWDRARVPSESIRAVVSTPATPTRRPARQGEANARRDRRPSPPRRSAAGPTTVLVASTGRDRPPAADGPGSRPASARPSAGSRPTSRASDEASRAILTTDTRPKVVSQRGDDRRPDGHAARAGQGGGDDRAEDGHDARLPPDRRPGRRRPTSRRSSPRRSRTRSTASRSRATRAPTTPSCSSPTAAAGGEPLAGDDLGGLRRAGPRRRASTLARMIPDDGEGATHLITIDVEGCRDRERGPDDRPGRRRQPARQDRDPRRRPELGPDRLGRRLRGRRLRGGRALALAQRRRRSTATASPLAFDAAAVSARLRARRETHDPARPRRTATPSSGSGPAT